MHSRRPHLALLLATLLATVFVWVVPAHSGIDVSAEKMVLQIDQMMQELDRLKNSPVFAEQQRIRVELETLQNDLDEARSRADGPPLELLRRVDDLRDRLFLVDREIRQIDEQRRALVESTNVFPKARNKVAVFTFDDLSGTGIGNAISFLISKDMLFSTRVGSYAIVNFQTDVSRGGEDGLTYFDKVEKLTRGFGYTVAVWGRVADLGDALEIDIFAQVPDAAAASRFKKRFTWNDRDGRSVSLQASLSADRIRVQTLRIPKSAIESILTAAQQVSLLRTRPDATAKVVSELPEGKAYYIKESSGDWVRLAPADGKAGWTSVKAFCRGDCARLLTASDFANDMVAFVEGKDVSEAQYGGSKQALVARDQMIALMALDNTPARAKAIAELRLSDTATDKEQQDIDPSPAGHTVGWGGFVNLKVLAEFSQAKDTMDRARVRELTGELAKASVAEPRNLDVLLNLSSLFGYLGDDERKNIAEKIAASIVRDQ